jgi:uncharacterized damage-inducible protein DinB
MAIAQSLLPEFDAEMASCRKELERIPDAQLDYRPHPKSFTLVQLANHLATIPGWVASTMNLSELDFSDPATLAGMPKPVSSRDELLAIFDHGVGAARTLLAQASDGDFAVTWSGKNDGQVLFAMPRIGVYRLFIMNHLIHHRAQLGVYLRLLDVPVPAIYGPTADETGA